MSSSSSSPGLFLALGSAGLYGLNIVFAGAASLGGVPGSALVVLSRPVDAGSGGGRCDAHEAHASALLPRSAAPWSCWACRPRFVGLCYLSSVAFIPVTVAAVVFYAYPSLIVLASPFVDGARLTPRSLAVVSHCSRRHHPRRGSGLHRSRLARPCPCADALPPRPRRNSSRPRAAPGRRPPQRSSGSI